MSEENTNTPQSASSNNLPWVVLAMVLLAILIGAVIFRDRLFGQGMVNKSVTESQTGPSGYQAIFLTNGQVYFGKLSNITGSFLTLNDIYYLQVAPQPPIQGSQPSSTAQQTQQQQQLLLIKLGEEMHGPVDEMHINKDQVLFYEDIKEEGDVMMKIREYQKNPPESTQGQMNSGQVQPTSAPVPTQNGQNRSESGQQTLNQAQPTPSQILPSGSR